MAEDFKDKLEALVDILRVFVKISQVKAFIKVSLAEISIKVSLVVQSASTNRDVDSFKLVANKTALFKT